MIKKFFSYFMVFACLLGTSVVTACSSDDDDEEDKLPELQYLNDAAIYQVEDNKDMIAYIELTTAGNYFIEYKTMAPTSPSSNAIANFEFGSFTKNTSDGTYQLNQKGTTLKIDGNTITLGDNSYTATKVGAKATLVNADNICRSWKVKKVSAKIQSPNMKEPILATESNYKRLLEIVDQKNGAFEYFEEIDYICFSNTYMYDGHLSCITKSDNAIARKVWQWKNGEININDAKQNISVTFEGSKMKLSHTTINGSSTTEWEYELTPLQSSSLN